MIETLEQLKTIAWRTSHNRYSASRRLKGRDLYSTISLSLLSVLTIAIALVQRLFRIVPESGLDNYLTLLSILFGFCIVVVSLIEWGDNSAVISEALFRNAEELNDFQQRLGAIIAGARQGEALTVADALELHEKYAKIRRSCPYNHSEIDDQLFIALHRKQAAFLIANEPRMNAANATYKVFSWRIQAFGYQLAIWLIVVVFIAGAGLAYKRDFARAPAAGRASVDTAVPHAKSE